ncbi:MAG: sulfatase, partial [Candidatus Brocadiia bacterium]
AYSWVGSNAPLAGQKGGLLEGGHRVPAVAYWPGKIKAGAVADETVLTMDLFPTMAAIAGAMVPNGLKLDGTDISDVLFRGRKLPERTVFWRTNGEGAVRKGQWKLLLDNKDKNGSGKLFNLADDIGEKNNLAGTEPEIVKSLRSEFDAWEKDVARKPS